MVILSRREKERLLRVLDEKNDTIYGQALLLQANEKEIAHLRTMLLLTYRATRDMADGFRVMQEEDMDMSDDLEEIVSELSDQIAQLEEHHLT